MVKCYQTTAEFQNSSGFASSINYMTSDINNADKLPVLTYQKSYVSVISATEFTIN